MSEGVAVARLRDDEIDDVAALAARCFDHGAWTAEDLRRELARPFAEVWVARVGGALAGHAVAWYLDGGELLTLGTDPAARRRGVGRALLARVLESARQREVAALTLEVRGTNVAAIALYRALGFDLLDRRRRYYADGEDAQIMVWRPHP